MFMFNLQLSISACHHHHHRTVFAPKLHALRNGKLSIDGFRCWKGFVSFQNEIPVINQLRFSIYCLKTETWYQNFNFSPSKKKAKKRIFFLLSLVVHLLKTMVDVWKEHSCLHIHKRWTFIMISVADTFQ